MNLIISGLHLKKFPKVEKYAREKVARLEKFHPKIEKISVNLISQPSHRDKNTDYQCELIVDIPGKNLEIKEIDGSMDKAVDKAVERMKVLLVKNKEKKLSEKHRETIRGQ